MSSAEWTDTANDFSLSGGATSGAAAAAATPTPLQNVTPQQQQAVRQRLRQARRPLPAPGRLAARARWSAFMWLPMALMLLHRQDAIARGTHGVLTVERGLSAGVLVASAIFFSERSNGPHWPVAVACLVAGFSWGALTDVLQDLPFVRVAAVMAFGLCSGQLRYHWELRRRKRAPSAIQLIWHNVVLRQAGLTAVFMAGETLGCVLCVPRGWALVSFSWYGYLLVLLLPYLTFRLAMFVTFLAGRVLGHAGHMGSDASRWIAGRWAATIVLSLLMLAVAVGYFLVNYIPHVWNQQLLVAPYGVVVELVSFQSRKESARVAKRPGGATAGRYDSVVAQYSGLISDIVNRSNDYHCH